MSLFARSGKVTTTSNPLFDNPAQPYVQFEGALTETAGGVTYNIPVVYQPGFPFTSIVQGGRQ